MEVLEANPQIKALLFNQMAEMGLDPQRYVVGDQLNSLNPVTGMPEFFFSSIFKGIKKAVKSVVKVVKKIAPVALPLIAAFVGFPFLLPATSIFAAGSMASMALASGIGTLISGGNLKDAFKSALISGGTAGIFGGLKGLAGAPKGSGFSGFGAGFKAAATGQVPIYGAAGSKAAGELIGYRAPATFTERMADLGQGNWSDAILGEGGEFSPTTGYSGLSIDPTTGLPPGATQYAAGLPGPTSTTLGAQSILQGGPSQVATSPAAAPGEFNAFTAWKDSAAVPTGVPTTVTSDLTRSPNLVQRAKSLIFPDTAPTLSRTEQVVAEYNNILAANPKLPTEYAWDAATKAVDAADKGPLLASLSPSKLLGIPEGGSNLVDAAAILTGVGLAGGYKTEPGEKPSETLAGKPVLETEAAREKRVKDAEAQQLAEASLNPFLFASKTSYVNPSTSLLAARGGSVNYPERDLLVEGPGTEKSDEIPAMLSDGEFVINSKAVRGADPSGRGNRYAGAQNLYNLMRNFEMRA